MSKVQIGQAEKWMLPVKPRIPREAQDHLKALLDAYDRINRDAHTVGAHPGSDAEITEIKQLVSTPAELWWTDLAQAELCLVNIEDLASARADLLAWRRRLHEVIGDGRYALYEANATPNPQTAPEPDVRADLSECIRAVYYFYGAYGVSARSRSAVTESLLRSAAMILLVLAVISILLAMRFSAVSWWPGLKVENVVGLEYLLLTSAAAVLGSVVSVQRRLQDPAVEVDPFYRFIQTYADRTGIAVISPLFGAIFGIVIYFLFVSTLVGGEAFPTAHNLLSGSASSKDIGLLVIYGFVAGFAEQLVPDALTRLATRTLGALGPAPAVTTVPAKQSPATGPALSPLTVSQARLNVGIGQSVTFTASDPSGSGLIRATSADPTIATVDSGTTDAQGVVTFNVTGAAANTTSIRVTNATDSKSLAVTVA